MQRADLAHHLRSFLACFAHHIQDVQDTLYASLRLGDSAYADLPPLHQQELVQKSTTTPQSGVAFALSRRTRKAAKR